MMTEYYKSSRHDDSEELFEDIVELIEDSSIEYLDGLEITHVEIGEGGGVTLTFYEGGLDE